MGSAGGRWKKGYRIKGCDQVYHLQGLLIEKSDRLFVCASVFIHHAARATDEKAGWIFGGQAMGFGLSVCVWSLDDGGYGCAILWRRTCQMFRAVRKFTF